MKKNKIFTFENIVFLIYFFVIALLAFNHEFSRDEFQVWTMVKELNTFEIIKQMQYEGHPCLWHLIINLFAELGFSYNIMEVISCTFALLGVWIFLHKSPFNKIAKLLTCFNITFLMFASVFARSYSLLLFLIMCLASIYERRKERPILYSIILALLVNTHVLICGLIGMLILKDLYEIFIMKEVYNKKNRIIGIAIVFVSILLLILQLYKCFQFRNHVMVNSFLISNLLFQIFDTLVKYFIFQTNYYIFALVSVLLLGILLYLLKKEKSYIFLIFSGSLLFKILVHIYIYDLYYQQSSLIILDLIFCLWCFSINKSNKILNILFIIIISLTLPRSFYVSYLELTKDYSDAYDTAVYIKNNINEENKILCLEDNYCTPVIGYLDDYNYTFISLYTKKEFSFIEWNVNFENYEYTEKELLDLIKEENIDYVISNDGEIDVFKYNDNYEVEYKTDTSNVIFDEVYTIYGVQD